MAKQNGPSGQRPAGSGSDRGLGLTGGLRLITSLLVLFGESIKVWEHW